MIGAAGKNRIPYKAGSVLLAAVLLFCAVLPAAGAENRWAGLIEETYRGLAAKRGGAPILGKETALPTPSAAGTDWTAIALARYGVREEGGTDFCLDEDYAAYLAAETAALTARAQAETFGAATKYTDYYRMFLTLRALGEEADVSLRRRCTSELTVPLKRLNVITLSFLLLCWEDSPAATLTRADVVSALISRRTQNLGWSLLPTGGADPDVTAMALTGLSTAKDLPEAETPIADGVALLSEMQGSDGTYASYGLKNAESTAQAIIALTSLGIDPETDPRFIKNGVSLADALLSFRLPDGTFVHAFAADPENPAAGAGVYNGMATDQALLALTALWRASVKLAPLYSASPDPAPAFSGDALARLFGLIAAFFALLRRFTLPLT